MEMHYCWINMVQFLWIGVGLMIFYGQGIDLISAVKKFHRLSSQELGKLLRDSENFTLQCFTEKGSSIQVSYIVYVVIMHFLFDSICQTEVLKYVFCFRLIWINLQGFCLCTLLQSLCHQREMNHYLDIYYVVSVSCIPCVIWPLDTLNLSRLFQFLPKVLLHIIFILLKESSQASYGGPLLSTKSSYFLRVNFFLKRNFGNST